MHTANILYIGVSPGLIYNDRWTCVDSEAGYRAYLPPNAPPAFRRSSRFPRLYTFYTLNFSAPSLVTTDSSSGLSGSRRRSSAGGGQRKRGGSAKVSVGVDSLFVMEQSSSKSRSVQAGRVRRFRLLRYLLPARSIMHKKRRFTGSSALNLRSKRNIG